MLGQTALERIKQQGPAQNLEIYDTPKFQMQVTNGELGKPLASTTPKLFNEDKI